MANIKLRCKLSAYSQGILPDMSNVVQDVQEDNLLYGRKDKEWQPIELISVLDNSGIEKIGIDANNSQLRLKQYVLKNNINNFEDDTTYYIYSDQAERFINGGTAFSDEDDDYGSIINGGKANTQHFALHLLPLNSKGV